jgi:hypothetical protein
MLALRIASVPVTALVVALGVWIAGGWISDDFRVSMGLTAVWFALAGTAAATIAWKFRALLRSHEHETRGAATLVRLPDARRYITLTGFATSPGPDLRVRLVHGDTPDGGAAGNVDLGALKGNRGNQQYAVPPGVRVRGASLVIWCRAFSAPFGSARLV